MKMTLHIDDALLDRVVSIYGCDSKTAAVDFALREMDRRHRLASYADTGLGMTVDELKDAVAPDYDVLATRQAGTGKTKGRKSK
jgi:Arc/MetJ family transcription regulator